MHSKEQKIRAKIDSQLALIGKEYRGLDRHRHTAALYKRFSYHPLMALRSASSILFQLPFLMAAYFMLSDHAGIKFQPISFISDLSKPDQYLF